MRRVVVWAILLGGAAAHGGGMAVSEQSAVAGGTGGAGVARSEDPAAAWYNPAALVDGSGVRAQVGLLLAMPSLGAQAIDGSWSASTASAVRTPPHLYLSYARGRWAAGLSVNVPFGSGVEWPADWRGRFEAVSSSLQVFRLAPFVGWRLAHLRLAAGVDVDIGMLSIGRRLDFVDTEGRVDISLSGAAIGGHGSLFLDLLPARLALGLAYRSRASLTMAGTAKFRAPDAFEAQATDQHARATLELPDILTLGAWYRPHARWTLVLDLGVAIWSVYDRLVIDFERQATADVTQAARWETRPFVRGGAEFRATDRVVVRAGLLYDPSPVPASTLAPNAPDSDRIGGTLGVGFRALRGTTIDAFYGYMQLLERASANPNALAARYGGSAHLIGIGVRYERQ